MTYQATTGKQYFRHVNNVLFFDNHNRSVLYHDRQVNINKIESMAQFNFFGPWCTIKICGKIYRSIALKVSNAIGILY